MKVSALNIDSKNVLQAKVPLRKPVCHQSFGGKAKASAELAKDITAGMKWLPKGLEWLQHHNGEILNAVVTAIGTACVAPVFIAFNPFSKEDKETKAYSAWRQPISAVLALATQYGIMVPYNKHIDKLASTGKFDRANLTARPTEGYLKSIIKSENPNRKFTKQELEEAVKEKQNNAMWDAITRARDEHKTRDLKIEEYIDDEARNAAKKEIEEEFKEQVSKMKDKAREKFIESKLPEKAKIVAEKQVNESTAVKFKASQLAARAKEKGQDYAQLLTDVETKIGKIKGDTAEKTLLTKAFEKLKSYGKYENMKYLGFTEEQIKQSVKIKKMIMAQVQEAQKVLKGYKTYTGIVVTLITLPFSCGLLNWVYPRLMEIIMPRKKGKHRHIKPADNIELNTPPKRKEGIR